MTLDHQIISLYFIKIYTSPESGINKLSIDSWFVRTIFGRDSYLKIWNLRVQKNPNIGKIAFKVVQMKSLETHIINQKLSLAIFTIMFKIILIEHDLYLIS